MKRFPYTEGIASIVREHKILHKNKLHNNYCIYLNSYLLEAPRDYVLHGLIPGLN